MKDKNNCLRQKKREFKAAVDNYREAISKDFYLPQGDSYDMETPRKKIIDLFKESPVSIRDSLLYIALKTMSIASSSSLRLTGYFRDLGVKLTDDLEKMKNVK